MQTEIEVKWLNIDIDEMRRKLGDLGAELVQPERIMVRRPYDFPDKRLEKIGGWVRVRKEGDKTTLCYKQLNDRTLHGTKEITVVVDDFDVTCKFLEAIGLVSKSYQETKRESWKLGEVEIELDTWPWVLSFIEIEAPSEEKLRESAAKLNLDFSDALYGSVEPVYQAVYDVTEEEIDSWLEIRFVDIPDWLEIKRKANDR
ncbi:MAG: CYTH domain-containing protein [Candidatus Saccharimonadaceae bacterium]|nr:CYTH domain-containing protein [Candidatus Saccharimonadaceae bacterium]